MAMHTALAIRADFISRSGISVYLRGMLRAIAQMMKRMGIDTELTGIDLTQECVQYAASRNPSMQFIRSNYRDFVFDRQPDILFNCVFCHHYSDNEQVTMLRWMASNATLGFFINDLHRHPLAYYSIRLLTSLFSQSYLVRHDAALSVMRGFRSAGRQALFQDAGLPVYSCEWKWAFRHLVWYRKP